MDAASSDAFDAAAERVRAAYATGDQRAADRAWTEFYDTQLRREIRARTHVWREMKEYGITAEDAEQEIMLSLWRMLKAGKVLNRAQLKRICSNTLVTLKRKSLDRKVDDGELIHQMLLDTRIREDDLRDLRRELTRIADGLERQPRMLLRSMVLRMMIAGEDNFAEIERQLGIGESSARTAFFYLKKSLAKDHPELREYLDTWEPPGMVGRVVPTRAGGTGREGE